MEDGLPDTALPTKPTGADDDSAMEADAQCIEQIMHEILARACSAPTTSAQEVLLDFDLGTSRFVLLRFPKADTPKPALSPRELEIVRMVSKGLPNKVIAKVLSISCWTVSTHVRRVFIKLGVTSRAAMVARTLELSTSDDRAGVDEVKTRPAIARTA
jgi:DNA-binding NarL/FixJ family response regulator